MEHLTQDELLSLLRAARARRERDFLFLLIAAWHGLRVSEVLQIKASDISGGFLTVKRLKGSKKTTQPLLAHENPLLNEKKALFEFTRNLRPNQKLFDIQRRQADNLIKQYGELAEVPRHKRHMHALKHTCGMQLVGKIKINELQQWMGHESGANTLKYLEVDDAEAGRAVKEAFSSDCCD